MFKNPATSEIFSTLAYVRTVAIIGISPHPERPSHRVARALQAAGLRIIPVRPNITSILGERVFPTLESIPEPIDLVDVFRSPEHVPGIVESCLGLGIPRLWLQQGVVHATAAQRARDAGIWVVMDRCLWLDYEFCRKG